MQRPLPDANALAEVFARLESHEEPKDIPEPGTQAEYDLFDALTVMFLEPLRWGRAREAVRRAVGNCTFEVLTAFLAFVRILHFWTETHPEWPLTRTCSPCWKGTMTWRGCFLILPRPSA